MAEGTRLLSEYGVTSPIEGSNPSLSVPQSGLSATISASVGHPPSAVDHDVLVAEDDQRGHEHHADVYP